MMALAFSMLSLFASFDEIGKSFESIIYQFLAPAVGEDLKQYIDQFAGQAGQLSFIGLMFFLLTALLLLFHIEESFNDIWQVKKGRSIMIRFPIYWTLVTVGPFFVLILPFLLEVAAFTVLYWVMPNVKVRFINALLGAVVASALFEISKKAFAVYLLNFGSYKVIYGALSALPIFLIWIYLCWIIALVGAQFTAVIKHKYLFLDQQAEPDLTRRD